MCVHTRLPSHRHIHTHAHPFATPTHTLTPTGLNIYMPDALTHANTGHLDPSPLSHGPS